MSEHTLRPGSPNDSGRLGSPSPSGAAAQSLPRIVVYPAGDGAGVELPADSGEGLATSLARVMSGRPVTPKTFLNAHPDPPVSANDAAVAEPDDVTMTKALPTPRRQTTQAPVAAHLDPFRVVFERPGGDVFEGYYHDVVDVGDGFLTLVFDHAFKEGVLCRPAPSEEPIAVFVEGHDGSRPAMAYLCHPTGYYLRHRDLEFQVFVVEKSRETQ